MLRSLALTALTALLLPLTAQAHEQVTLDEMTAQFGWDFESVQIRSQKITDGLHVLFGVGGNIGASIGEDGVLLVDDQFPQVMEKVLAELDRIGGGQVRYAINTHWHFDHAEGNLDLGKRGVTLVSQVNSRNMMLGDHNINLVMLNYEQKAYPKHALPSITYDRTMQFFFNGERIDLFHGGPAHTTGDTAVIFRGRNVVHMGDVFNNAGYPFIDADNGGEQKGMINFCRQVIDQIDRDTVVIPGHGPITNYQAMVDYVNMLTTVRNRLQALIAAGASFEEAVAAKPTAEFDERYGDPGMLLDRAWKSLLRSR